MTARGRLEGLDLARPDGAGASSAAPATSRPVYFKETGLAPCPVLAREALAPGAERPGPVVVESMDTTIVVPPGWRLRVDARGVVLLEASPHG